MDNSLIYDWNRCSEEQQQQLLTRPALQANQPIEQQVATILQQVKQHGDQALYRYAQQFDHTQLTSLAIDTQQIANAQQRLNTPLKQAIQLAATNIATFHQAQKNSPVMVNTQAGVTCQQVTRPLQSVGLYIPGGSAPLLSTALMLAIPAKLAGCQQIVLCSPPPIDDAILYIADQFAIRQVFAVGGAQAIAAMAYGTSTVPKVNKIFGPGNAFVTEAKKQISLYANCAIDMPAGPSEVLIIADSHANADFVAADLLAQAEHGADSQVMLLTNDHQLAQTVAQLIRQPSCLPRAAIIQQSLQHCRLIVCDDIAQCVDIANRYAPEHLIIQTHQAEHWVGQIHHAGSVFVGPWSPESVGDYASGTNHVLPTYGASRSYSSLGLADFQRRMTVQHLTAAGLINIAPTVQTLAQAEGLLAHQQAVTVRLAYLTQQTKEQA